ncbi:MAG: pentapeptide repeat-containing protein [Planctomycetota bacterium]
MNRLHKAHFHWAHLHKAHLHKAHLHKAHLHKAHLHKAHFHRAHFHRAHFHRARLHEADLKRLNPEKAIPICRPDGTTRKSRQSKPSKTSWPKPSGIGLAQPHLRSLSPFPAPPRLAPAAARQYLLAGTLQPVQSSFLQPVQSSCPIVRSWPVQSRAFACPISG